MLHNEETRAAVARRRASEDAVWSVSNSEDTLHLLDRQARWLALRLNLTIDRARLVAGLAFTTGGAR
jgi:hypothetical protein